MTTTQNPCPRTDSVRTEFVPMTSALHRDRCVNCGEKLGPAAALDLGDTSDWSAQDDAWLAKVTN